MGLKEYLKMQLASIGLVILAFVLIVAAIWIGMTSLYSGNIFYTILAVILFVIAVIILIASKYYSTKARRSIAHKIKEE